jgi:hypothetical protein
MNALFVCFIDVVFFQGVHVGSFFKKRRFFSVSLQGAYEWLVSNTRDMLCEFLLGSFVLMS